MYVEIQLIPVSGLSNQLNDTYNSGAIGSENTIKIHPIVVLH